MSGVHDWSREIVVGWVATIDDVPTLQAWFDACRSRLSQLNAPRRGAPLEVGRDLYANGGDIYVIRRVEKIPASGDLVNEHILLDLEKKP